MISLALLAPLFLRQDPAPQYDMKVLPFCVLEEPKATKQDPKLMESHLKFLQGLYETRKALIVGPLEDAGNWAGIIVFDTKREEAEELVKKDPLVASGFLQPKFYGWFCARNVPKQGPKFLDIEPLWFGRLDRPDHAPTYSKEESDKIQEGHMANIMKMAASGDLVLAGPMTGDTAWRGIFVFRTPDKKRIEELTANDTAIQKGRLKLTLFRWYVTKGTFPVASKS